MHGVHPFMKMKVCWQMFHTLPWPVLTLVLVPLEEGAHAYSRISECHLQDSFWDRIQGVRNQELAILWKSAIVASCYAFLLNTVPVIVSVVTFTVYVLLGNNLTAAKAFTSLSLFTVRLHGTDN